MEDIWIEGVIIRLSCFSKMPLQEMIADLREIENPLYLFVTQFKVWIFRTNSNIAQRSIALPLFRHFIDDAIPVKYEQFAIRIATEVDGLKRTFRDLGGNAGFFRFANWNS